MYGSVYECFRIQNCHLVVSQLCYVCEILHRGSCCCCSQCYLSALRQHSVISRSLKQTIALNVAVIPLLAHAQRWQCMGAVWIECKTMHAQRYVVQNKSPRCNESLFSVKYSDLEVCGVRRSILFIMRCVESEATLLDLDLLSDSLWTKTRCGNTTEEKYVSQALISVAFECWNKHRLLKKKLFERTPLRDVILCWHSASLTFRI